jgi:hypothetical protein
MAPARRLASGRSGGSWARGWRGRFSTSLRCCRQQQPKEAPQGHQPGDSPPGPPLDVDIYELTAEEKAHIRGTPGSLAESLDALEADHDFLLAGGVFTPDVIETYLDYKRSRELIQVAIRPHPYEFFMYFDA